MPGAKLQGFDINRGYFRVWAADREVLFTTATIGTTDRYLAEQTILTALQTVFDDVSEWYVRVHEVEPLVASVFVLGPGFTQADADASMREP